MTSYLRCLVTATLFGCATSLNEEKTTTVFDTETAGLPVDVDGDGYRVEDGDCDDEDAESHPNAWEIPYDGVDQDCDGLDLVDFDADGYDASEVGGPDCDDTDPSIHPGIPVDDCGGGDEDCDGLVDEDEDIDQDGISSCSGDCDDEDFEIYPGAYDIAENGIDENCNGVDKGGCGDAVYDAVRELWVGIRAYSGDPTYPQIDLNGLTSSSWQIPEDAYCTSPYGTASWSERASFSNCGGVGVVTLDGDFSLSLSSGCGSFAGEVNGCNGLVYPNGNGTIGDSQSCF